MSERNAEVRRCAIEVVGWDTITDQLTLVSAEPDPGNAPHALRLYDLPESLRDMWDDEARVLVCVNGSVERDGTRRSFGLPVPAHHTSAVAAAADLADVPVSVYRRMQVRK